MDTIDFYCIIHTDRCQTSKEKIANAKRYALTKPPVAKTNTVEQCFSTPEFYDDLLFVDSNSGMNRAFSLKITGWTRDRENNEFGYQFFHPE